MNLMDENDNIKTIICTFNEICKKLRVYRNDSKMTIDQVADWLKVDRRKIIALENCERFDLELLCAYCDKFSIELELKYKVY